MKRHRRALSAAALFLALNVAVVRAFGAPAEPSTTAAPMGAAESAQPAVAAPARQSEASPGTTRELLQSVIPPARDESDLARRFKATCATPAAQPVPLFRAETEGESRPFWVLDEPNRRFFQVQATLRYASEHLLFYVQDGQQYSRDALAASATTFEQKTFPILRQYFGDAPGPARVTIFNGRVPGVGGYYSSSDLLPASVNQYSNERPMVFMSLDGTRPGTASYDAVLAHEIQHFIHSQVHPQQDSWINEGASELAMALAGYEQGGPARTYLNNPETQLNAWADRPSESQAHYGAGYLILEYFAQRLGGYDKIKDLIASPGSSVRTFETYFDRAQSPLRFDDLYRDFVLANVLNDRSVADGRFGHEKVTGRARMQETYSGFPVLSNAAVRPYATRYVELNPGTQRGALELRFAGSGDTRLYNATPRSGAQQWWGNAVDDMASSLTREFDLTGVERATLRFSTWYSTERDYDYGGVAVSTDGGCSWRTLRGRYTTDTDPTGQNLGHGFTGKSIAGGVEGWVDEEMDLTPYAGQKALVRFYYVTDQSYHGPGFAVDDISVPEIGFHDDAEQDQGWETLGFLRSVNAAAVDWAVQVVAFTDAGPQIHRLMPVRAPEGGAAEGTLVLSGFGDTVRRVVVALSPLVPVTLEPAEYRLQALVR